MVKVITYQSSLSDDEFIQQFEQQTLAPDEFDHLGHLRIAWLYLNRESLSVAVYKVCHGIKQYAESLGATDKFHHTLTEAIVRLMAVKLRQGQKESFDSFLEAYSELVNDLPQEIAKHYSKEVLDSMRAKKEYIAPDLIDFEEISTQPEGNGPKLTHSLL